MTVDVDALLASVDIATITGHYTTLKKQGAEYVGRCLWHSPDAHPSMSVVPAKRMVYCFACGAGGSAIDVVMQAEGLDFKGACERLNGGAPSDGWKPRVKDERPAKPTVDRITCKPPGVAPDSAFKHRDFGQPDVILPFRDAEGDVIGYECRWQRAEGKESRVLTYGQRGDDKPRWGWGHFTAPRPLWGLDELAAKSRAQVVVFEGPIKAQAARDVFPAHACIAWSGGARSWNRSDWTPLRERNIVLWPDNDTVGLQAVQSLGAMLADAKGLDAAVRWIDPNRQPDGWDIRDALAEGWDAARILAFARERATQINGAAQEPQRVVEDGETGQPPAAAPPEPQAGEWDKTPAAEAPDLILSLGGDSALTTGAGAGESSVNPVAAATDATASVPAPPPTTGGPPELPAELLPAAPAGDLSYGSSSGSVQQQDGSPTNEVEGGDSTAHASTVVDPANTGGAHPTERAIDAADEALASLNPVHVPEPPNAGKARSRAKSPRLHVVSGETNANAARDPDPDGKPAPFPLSPDAIADYFAATHQENWRYVNEWGRWLFWDDGTWQPDRTDHSFQKMREVCSSACYWPEAASLTANEKRKLTYRAYIGGALHLAGRDRRLASQADQWDTDPYMLGVPGGVVDLRIGKLIEGAREQYISKRCSVAPEPGACAVWLSLWERIAQGDDSMLAYFRRMWGYILTGDTREEVFFFFYGKGRSGKSKPVRAMQEIMGDYAQAATSDTFMQREREQHSSEIAVMAGARLVVVSENEEGKRLNESRVKQLSGQDIVRARLMRQDGGDFVPHLKILMYGNFQPALRGTGAEIRDRIHMVQFPDTIPEEERDKFLAEKLRAEYPQILHWAIQGCLEWQTAGLGRPEAIELASRDYVDSQDTIGEWLGEQCELKDGYREQAGAVYDDWKRWAAARDEYVGSPKRLTQKLKDRGFRTLKSGKRYIEGLRLLHAPEQPRSHYAD